MGLFSDLTQNIHIGIADTAVIIRNGKISVRSGLKSVDHKSEQGKEIMLTIEQRMMELLQNLL